MSSLEGCLPDPTVEAEAGGDQQWVWDAVADAFAGVAPLPVSVSRVGDNAALLDAGVWQKLVHLDERAPSGAALLSAVSTAILTFGVDAVVVAATSEVAEFLSAAVHKAVSYRDVLDGDARRVRLSVAGFEVTAALLAQFGKRLERCSVTVQGVHSPALSEPSPVLVASDLQGVEAAPKLRFSVSAEAAYHSFCARHGFELVASDGSAQVDGPHAGVWGWAWWSSPQRWRAQGGLHGSSLEAELSAAIAAVRDNAGRNIAVTYDCRSVRRAARGEVVRGVEHLAGQLNALCEARGAHERVVWFPLSARSMSVLQWEVDDVARRAMYAAESARFGPWSNDNPVPFFRDRMSRIHPYRLRERS